MRYWLVTFIFSLALNAEAASLLNAMPSGMASLFTNRLPENLKQTCRSIESYSQRSDEVDGFKFCSGQIGDEIPNRNRLVETCFVLLSEEQNVYSACIDEFKIHYNLADYESLQAEQELIGKHDTSALDKEELKGLYSSAMQKCQPVDIGVCTEASVQFNLPFDDLLSSIPEVREIPIVTFEQPIYDSVTCDCLETKLNYHYTAEGINTRFLKNETEKHKKIINSQIEKSLGQKFINDFSVGLEDVNYYLTNNFKALDNELKLASDLQCNDPQKFKNAMKESCAKNNVDEKTRDENLNGMMGEYVNRTEHPNFESSISALTNEILNLNADKKTSRAAYDIARLGIINQSPKLHFMNQLLTNIIEDTSLHGNFDTTRNLQEETPGEVLNNLLERMDKGLLQGKIDSIIKQGKKGKLTKEQKEFYNNATLLNKSVNKNEIKKLIKEAADFSVMQYPGYRALLKDFDLFNKVIKSGSSESIITTLESNPELLSGHYSNNCKKLVNQIAEAACTPKNDYVKKATPEELNRLINYKQLNINPEIKDLLLCQSNRGNQSAKLPGLIFENHRILLSDYAQKKFNTKEFNKSGYESFQAALKDEGRNKSYFSAAASAGREIRTTSGIEKLLGQQHAAADPKEQTVITPTALPATLAETTKDLKTETVNNNFQAAQPPTSNYNLIPMNNVAKKETTDKKSETKLDSKTLLREFLSNENNKEELDEHLSNASNEDVQKLMELKDLIAQDQNRLNDLISQTDKVKLQNMESNLKKMEQEMKESIKKERTDGERRPLSSYNQNGFQTSVSQQNNISDQSFREISRGNDSSSAGSARVSSSRSSSGALAGGARSPASIPEVTRAMDREVQDGMIVIESNIVRTSGKPFARDELSKEIISYVSTSQLNLSELMKLKESGLVLKVKAIKDGKEILEEIRINYHEMTTEAQMLLENKIAGVEKEQEYERLKREYSYLTLKLLLATKAQTGL